MGFWPDCLVSSLCFLPFKILSEYALKSCLYPLGGN